VGRQKAKGKLQNMARDALTRAAAKVRTGHAVCQRRQWLNRVAVFLPFGFCLLPFAFLD
jgi:hypothetical protein